MTLRRLLALSLLAAAACGSVDEKPKCSTSASCAAGQYCARTPDGDVCWPDAAPPSIASVTVTCDTTPCVRDAKLTVQVSASDAEELAAVEVSLDLDPARWVALSKAGSAWTGQLALREWAFPAFSRGVVATARARDGARNEVTQVAAGVDVTRLRWAVEAKAGSTLALSPPAIHPDGTIIVGNANHELLFLTPTGTQAEDPLSIGGGAITSVAVGDKAIWVGNTDNQVRAVSLEKKAILAGLGVNVGGPIRGGLAVLPGSTEWAFAGGEGGQLGGASSTAGLDELAQPASFISGPAITSDAKVCGAITGASSSLRCYTFVGGALETAWTTGIGTDVTAALAIDGVGTFFTGSADGKVFRTSSAGAAAPPFTLPDKLSESAVLLTSGDVVVGDLTGLVHRITIAGTEAWSPAANVGGIPLAPLALVGGSASFLVGTRNGLVRALASDGSTVWNGALTGAPALQGTNISLPSTETPVTSTAYFSASNGKVYAVIVDGTLDTDAPWPKAFRDRRNRSNAGAAP